MQEAFFFGRDQAQVFACYHPPLGGDGRVLTVVCPPLLSEYPRTHRALRDIALLLAAAGQHVIRFDYRGTGDSSGDLNECSVADWLRDITDTIAEGRDIADCSMVRVLAVRASALIACAAVGAGSEVDRIVLWDPVLDGAAYLDELRQAQQALLQRNNFLSRTDRQLVMSEYGGYTLSGDMVRQLSALGAQTYAAVPPEKLWVVTTSADAGVPETCGHRELTPFNCSWDHVATDVVVPRPVLETLRECLTRP